MPRINSSHTNAGCPRLMFAHKNISILAVLAGSWPIKRAMLTPGVHMFD